MEEGSQHISKGILLQEENKQNLHPPPVGGAPLRKEVCWTLAGGSRETLGPFTRPQNSNHGPGPDYLSDDSFRLFPVIGLSDTKTAASF